MKTTHFYLVEIMYSPSSEPQFRYFTTVQRCAFDPDQAIAETRSIVRQDPNVVPGSVRIHRCVEYQEAK